MVTGDTEIPDGGEDQPAKPVSPPQRNADAERLVELSEIKNKFEDKNNQAKSEAKQPKPQTEPKPEASQNGEESAKFTELLDKQRKLIQEVIGKGQNLLEAWTMGWGMGLIKPIDSPPESGRQNLPAHWRHSASSLLSTDSSFSQKLSRDGIYETVVIKPVTQDVIAKRQTTKRVAKQGLFGRTKYVDKKIDENYVASQKPATMRDATNVDSSEPASALYYEACDVGDITLPISERYLDGYGRPGNSLNLKIVIPQNLSEQVSAAIREDPGFPRKLVHRLVRQKYPQQFVSETWNTFGAPPYDSWDRHTQPKLLFLDMQTEPELNKPPSKLPNYDRSHVIQYTTKVVNGSYFGIPAK